MFKSLFSFEGRIRRKEYCISFALYITVITLLQYLIEPDSSYGSQGNSILFLLVYLFCLFLMIAQSSKRCHDIGRSAWYQLIPFYVFWLLFADSQKGINIYGANPKGVENIQFSFESELEQADQQQTT